MKSLIVLVLVLTCCTVESPDDTWIPPDADQDPWVPPTDCYCLAGEFFCAWGSDYGSCDQGIVDLIVGDLCGVVSDGFSECGDYGWVETGSDETCTATLEYSGACDDFGVISPGGVDVSVVCPSYSCSHHIEMLF
jgi:hypothetical protein